MPTTCDNKLAGEFVKKCGYRPKQGIRKKWYFNWEDVDRVATQMVNRGTKVSVLVLKVGKKFYLAEGNDKSHKGKFALAISDFGNGHIHTDSYNVSYNGENERERIQELVEGARICSIVEKVDGGVNGELSFEIFGLESGMLIIDHNYDSAANSGTVSISVATKAGEEENTGAKLFLLAAGAIATEAYINTNTYVAPIVP